MARERTCSVESVDLPLILENKPDAHAILSRSVHLVPRPRVLARPTWGRLLGQPRGVQFAAEIWRKYPNGIRELADGGTWETLAGQPTDDSEISRVATSSLPFLTLPKSRLWRYFADDR